MPVNRHFAVTDTETTGLNPELGHEVVQLSAIAIDGSTLDWHPAGKFNVFIKPQQPEKADKQALTISGPAFEKAMKEGLEPKVAYQAYLDWMASINPSKKVTTKPLLWGHNLAFDTKFIKHFMKLHKLVAPKAGDREDYPWFLEMDTATLLLALYDTDPAVNDLKLNTALAQENLVRANETHDSLEDCELTAKFLINSMKFLRTCQKKRRVFKNNNIPV